MWVTMNVTRMMRTSARALAMVMMLVKARLLWLFVLMCSPCPAGLACTAWHPCLAWVAWLACPAVRPGLAGLECLALLPGLASLAVPAGLAVLAGPLGGFNGLRGCQDLQPCSAPYLCPAWVACPALLPGLCSACNACRPWKASMLACLARNAGPPCIAGQAGLACPA